jgi:hypothetical protein
MIQLYLFYSIHSSKYYIVPPLFGLRSALSHEIAGTAYLTGVFAIFLLGSALDRSGFVLRHTKIATKLGMGQIFGNDSNKSKFDSGGN